MTPKGDRLDRALPAASVALAALAVALSLLPAKRRSPDAAGFCRLPTLEGGRLKPLDTIARSSLLMLRGKQTVPAEGRTLEACPWLLDVLARPDKADAYKAFYIDDPDVLGLMARQGAAERYYSFKDMSPFFEEFQRQATSAEKLEAPARSRFQTAMVNLKERLVLYQRLKNTLSIEGAADLPGELQAYEAALRPGLEAVAAHRRSERFDRRALEAVSGFFSRYRFLEEEAEFYPIPPPDGEKPEEWASVGASLLEGLRAGELAPAVWGYGVLLNDYASGDAASFDVDLATLRARLEARQPRSSARAAWEAVFNRAQPFYIGMILYVAVFLLAVASWLWRPRALQGAAYSILILAFAIHTAGVVARMVLEGRPPVTNLYSSALFVGWTAVLVGAVVERLTRRGLGSAVASAMGFATLLIAHHLTGSGDTMEMMRAVLDSNFWLGTHVVTITIGYGGTFLAGALAHVYILRGALTASLDKETAKSLAGMTYGVVCFSLLLSFIGTILGGIWADQSWGRFWGWDPKENGALLIVLWNAVILHARWGGFVRERGFMIMAVFGCVVTSLSWFGVNMLGIGLHSYGFMDKAFEALMIFIAIELAVMALAALPIRRWRSFAEAAS